MSNKPLLLEDIVSILRRRKLHFTLPATIILIISGALAYLLPPAYLSSATILIEQQEIPRDMVASTVTGYAAERIEMIRNRVMTRDNLWQIAEKFDLYPDKKSLENQDDIITQMREDILLTMVSSDALDPKSGKPITVTIAFTLSYENPSPELAQNVTKELADLYLNQNRLSRTENARETSKFINTEAQRLSTQISGLEAQLSDFKAKNSLYLPDSIQGTRASLDGALQQRDLLTAKQGGLEVRSGFLKNQLDAYGSSAQLAKARAELAAAREKYSDVHPDVLRLKRSVDLLQAEIDQADRSGVAGAYVTAQDNPEYIKVRSEYQEVIGELRATQLQLGDIDRKIADYESRLAKAPEIERNYMTLSRDLDYATRKYQEISDKLTGAQLAEELEREQKAERFTLIEAANYPTTPIRPNRLGVILLGLIFALGGGLGVAAVAEYLDRRILGPKELASVFGAPPLAMIPEIPAFRSK